MSVDLVLDETTFDGAAFILTDCSSISLTLTLRGGSLVVVSDSELGSTSITIDNTARTFTGGFGSAPIQIHNTSFGSIIASNGTGLAAPPTAIDSTLIRLYSCQGSDIMTNTANGGFGGIWVIDNCTFEQFAFTGPVDTTDTAFRVHAAISNTKFLGSTGFSQDNTIDGNYRIDLQSVYISTSAFLAPLFDVNAKILVRGSVGNVQWGNLRMTNCFSRVIWHDDVGIGSGGPARQIWDMNSSVIQNPFPAFFGEFHPIRTGPNTELRINNNTFEKQAGYLSFMVFGSTVTTNTIVRGANHYIPTQAICFGGNMGFAFISQATTDDNTLLSLSASTVLSVNDLQKIVVVTGARAVTITLPTLGTIAGTTQNSGLFVTIKNRSAAGITVSPAGGDLIDGAGAIVLAVNGSRTFTVQDMSGWLITASF